MKNEQEQLINIEIKKKSAKNNFKKRVNVSEISLELINVYTTLKRNSGHVDDVRDIV